jgi:flagellar FliL protein
LSQSKISNLLLQHSTRSITLGDAKLNHSKANQSLLQYPVEFAFTSKRSEQFAHGMSFDCTPMGVYVMAEEAKKDKKDDGKKAKGAEAEAKTAEAPEGSKKKKLIIIGAIAGVVVVGGGVGGFLMFSGGDSAPPTAAAADSASPSAPSTSDGAKAANADGSAATPPEAAPAAGGEQGASATAASDSSKAAAKDPAVESDIGFGESYAFKTFHLNLGNPLENHYIRLEISAEYKGGEKQKAEIERRLPQLRDAVVSVVSSKSREFLLGPDGKAQLRREILIKINRYMTTPIESIFITDLLIE